MNNQPIVRLRSLRVKAGKHPSSSNALFLSVSADQSGAVLIISLIMLLLLTLIGASSMQTTTLEEKMAGNMRDRNIAFQAAESALRDAEQDIRGIGTTPRNDPIVDSKNSNFVANCNQDNIANTDDDGLCYRRWGFLLPAYVEPSYAGTSISWPAFTSYLLLTVDMTKMPIDGKSVAYGRFTGALPIAGIPTSAQPRYIIEGHKNQTYYRITVRAQGSSANTVVWLQEVFKPL
jgi:type IV pilus assembly protein PilX